MLKSTLKFTALALVAGFMSVGCNNGGDKGVTDGTDTVSEAKRKDEAKKIIYSVPSPVEMASILQKAGSKYDKDILNDLENVSKYTTNDAKALNLGVYGSDLAYTSVFNQTQETMFYLKAAQKLSDELGITNAFNKNTVDRIEANLNSRDSLMQIISDSYLEIDSYLEENERQNISALMVAGGWVEGLHLATKVAMQNPTNKDMMARIADQKVSLDNLLGLLSSYPEDESILSIVNPLLSLKAIFDKINAPAPTNQKVTVNEKTHVATIGGDNDVPAVISPEQLKAISEKTEEIRNSIIN